MNKKSFTLALVLAFVVGVVGCKSEPKVAPAYDANKPQPALKTTTPVAPPKGCKELRARGGAC
jgi:hypothetical protein